MDNQPARATAPVAAPDAKLHCPACGYNLTGLTSDKCPECGQLVTVVAVKEQVLPTTALSVAIVGCRLLALYLLYSLIVQVGSLVLQLTTTLGGYGSRMPPFAFWVPQIAVWILHFIMALALWFVAPWLAQRMIPQSKEPTRLLPTDGRMLLTAGCVVVGLFVLAHGLGTLVAMATNHLAPVPKMPAGMQYSTLRGDESNLISAAVQTLLGLWLIFGSGSLTRAIIYLRGLGPTAAEKK